MATDVCRFTYIAATTLAIIFNCKRCRRVSLAKQCEEPLHAMAQLV